MGDNNPDKNIDIVYISLLDNYAVRRLKEKIISQVAAQVIFEEGVKYVEQEMEIIDKNKRIQNPPRHLKLLVK